MAHMAPHPKLRQYLFECKERTCGKWSWLYKLALEIPVEDLKKLGIVWTDEGGVLKITRQAADGRFVCPYCTSRRKKRNLLLQMDESGLLEALEGLDVVDGGS